MLNTLGLATHETGYGKEYNGVYRNYYFTIYYGNIICHYVETVLCFKPLTDEEISRTGLGLIPNGNSDMSVSQWKNTFCFGNRTLEYCDNIFLWISFRKIKQRMDWLVDIAEKEGLQPVTEEELGILQRERNDEDDVE